jgi:hypothetical protein
MTPRRKLTAAPGLRARAVENAIESTWQTRAKWMAEKTTS